MVRYHGNNVTYRGFILQFSRSRNPCFLKILLRLLDTRLCDQIHLALQYQGLVFLNQRLIFPYFRLLTDNTCKHSKPQSALSKAILNHHHIIKNACSCSMLCGTVKLTNICKVWCPLDIIFALTFKSSSILVSEL